MAPSSSSSTKRRPVGNSRGRPKAKGGAVSRRRPSKPSRPAAKPAPVGYNTDSVRIGPSSDRFAGRRQEIRRRHGARRLRVVLALTVVSLLAVSTIGVLNSDLADVDAVTVVGNERTSTAEVVAATSIRTGQPLLDLDLPAAEVGVEALSWVRKAELERRLDGEIIVRVTEREPVLALPVAGDGTAPTDRASGRYVLIDQLGQQLEVVNERPSGFLPITGIEASGRPGDSAPEETGLILSLVQALPPTLVDRVDAMTVSEGDLHLELATGGRANFGDSSLLGEKIQALETVLARVDLTCASIIDLRVPSAAAVRRAEAAEGVCI